MRKTKPAILQIALIATLALAASAAITATASAQEAVGLFSFCHNVGANNGRFTNNTCGTSGTGEYLLAYADTSTSLWLCVEEATSVHKWTNLGCNVLAPGSNTGYFEELLSTAAGTPTLLGIPLDPATLKGTAATQPTAISCLTGKFTAQPEAAGGLSHGELTYTDCAVAKPANCSVEEPILGNFTGKTIDTPTDKVLFIGSKVSVTTKELFAEISYLGSSCALKGDIFPIHGQQYCEGLAGILTLKILQTLECRATESSLKLGAEPATYENRVSLDATSKEYWAILLVTE